jgi:tetratricopeptide (TPR) repeat protein
MAKAARRHPRTLIVTMAITLFALIGVAAAALLLNRERAVAQFERDEAFENLEIALEAVDEMYGNFSESWITTDQALSDTQMLFLNRSAGIYQSIARRVAGRPEFQVTAARILQRSGAAHARLGNLREAVAVTIQAIDEMPASSDDAVSPDMIAAYEQLGEIYATMGRLSEAREAFAKAQEHLGNLPQVERREFDVALTELRLSYKQADLCCQEYDDRTVAALGNELIERLTARIREDRDSFELHQLAIRTRTLLACSLRRSGSPDSAREVMRLALRKSLHALNDATDRVDVVKAMVQANQEYAMALHELGVDDEAEKLLRASMQLLRSSFIFDGTPKEFSFKALAAKAPHYQMQPTLFCEYARTQMVLSRVMRSTARMQEGAEQAEEAVRTCATLTRLFPSEVSYAIAAIEAATEWLLYPLPAEPKDAQLRIQWVSTLMSEIGSTQSDASSSIPFRTMLAEVNAAFASRKLEQGEHELAVVAGQAAVALQRSVLADVAESDVLRKRLAAYEQALAAMTANP